MAGEDEADQLLNTVLSAAEASGMDMSYVDVLRNVVAVESSGDVVRLAIQAADRVDDAPMSDRLGAFLITSIAGEAVRQLREPVQRPNTGAGPLLTIISMGDGLGGLSGVLGRSFDESVQSEVEANYTPTEPIIDDDREDDVEDAAGVTCAICMEVCRGRQTTSCGHDYCRKCLREWRRRPAGVDCPVCRAPLEPRAPVEANTDESIDVSIDVSDVPDRDDSPNIEDTDNIRELVREALANMTVPVLAPPNDNIREAIEAGMSPDDIAIALAIERGDIV
jgi:hypothetical protein